MVPWKWPQNNDRNVISPQFEPTVNKCKDEYIIFTWTLAVLLWELCLIRHKPFYKIQVSFYQPLSFQYTSINRQRLISLINVSPFRQSNKKLLPSFAITSGTKRNPVTVPDTVCIMKNVFSVRLGLRISFSRSRVIAKDGSRFVIPLSERKILGFYWRDEEKIEFNRMVYGECSTVLIIKRQKWMLYRQN